MAGLLVTTADISDQDFMNGAYNFSTPGEVSAMIMNKGNITVREAGMAAFVAPGVRNEGVISAKMGQVTLASGSTFTLDLYGDGLTEIAIDQETASAAFGKDKALVENTGKIDAEGGRVLVSANAAKGLVDNVINMDGIVRARGAVQNADGSIEIFGSGGGVMVAGALDASGSSGKGGNITVTGESVQVTSTAKIDASGTAGGGTVRIGGDYQGKGGTLEKANTTTVEKGARIHADATENGDGGTVIVWAEDTTRFGAAISARGGEEGGDGGFVEVSGKQNLGFSGTVDTRAPNGETGMLLLDPDTANISNNPDELDGVGTDNFNVTNLETILGTTDVTVAATTLIDVQVDINAGGTGKLTLDAPTVDLSGDISVAGGFMGMNVSTVNVRSTAASIQDGIDIVDAGGTVIVADGTFTENITIGKSLTLLSENGRDSTTIEGIPGAGALATIVVNNNADNVQIGAPGQGFTIIGIDNGNPAIENGAINLTTDHDGFELRNNEVVANGDHGFFTNFGSTITNMTVDGNIFSGQTFTGANPAGIGFSEQFTKNNVPRQLFVLNGGTGASNAGITFINNQITSRTGGISTDDGTTPQGNTAVTLDFNDTGGATSTISGNTFTPDTGGPFDFNVGGFVGVSLRVRGTAGTNAPAISSNTFGTPGGPNLFEPFFTQNSYGLTGRDVRLTNTINGQHAANNNFILFDLQPAMDTAIDGDIVVASAGTFATDTQVFIDKDLTITGQGKGVTIINPSSDTTDTGDGRGWFLVDNGQEFNMNNLTLDGSGFRVWQAVRHKGSGTFDSVHFTNIQFEPSVRFRGTGIVVFGGGNLDVTNSMFTNMGRIGAQFFGAGTTGTFINNTYVGKGEGNFLDYGVEVGGGASAIISGNNISNNLGFVPADGSVSAGILVTSFFGGPSEAVISGNTLSNNTSGIHIGFGASDSSVVTIGNGNVITGGTNGIFVTGDSVQFVGNTIGNTVFSGQSGFYVQFARGALFNPDMPTMINGKQATYDGVSGLAPTPEQAAAIEAMLFDFDDMATLGDIDFMTFPVGGGGVHPIIENGTGSQTDTGNAREVDFDDPFEAAFGAPHGGPYFLNPWGGLYSLGAASACASADTMLEDFWEWIKCPDFDWTPCEFQDDVEVAKQK